MVSYTVCVCTTKRKAFTIAITVITKKNIIC